MPSIRCCRGLSVSLVLASALLCWPLAAADVETESDVDLKFEEGGTSFTNTVGVKLVRLEKGKFWMGAAQNEPKTEPVEKPQHRVELTKDFYLGVYEVTQKQFRAVMGHNLSYFNKSGLGSLHVKGHDTDDFPAENVSWYDAMEFVEKLNAKTEERTRGRVYRLPTEAEWEYACRGGSDVKESYTLNKPVARLHPTRANYGETKLLRTCKVGSYQANPFGLYDMHGNVTEWCSDWYGDVYKEKDRKDPTGPKKGQHRVMRGGGWNYELHRCCSWSRDATAPSQRQTYYGFRVACDVRR